LPVSASTRRTAPTITLDPKTGKRQFLGRNLGYAVEAVDPTRSHLDYEALETVIDIDRAVGNLMSGAPGAEVSKPNRAALDRVLSFARSQDGQPQPETQSAKSRQRLSDCLAFWVNWHTNDDPNAMTPNIRNAELRFQKFMVLLPKSY